MSLTQKDLGSIKKIVEVTFDKKFGPSFDKKFSEKVPHIKKLVEVTIDEKTETVLATKEDLKNLPTKDEFYEKMDELMVEVKASREEQTVLAHQVSGHEDRITKLEEAHP